ncbi:MAG TPA: cupin domain-containing protein [Oscillatoriaceae cyanobacterium]
MGSRTIHNPHSNDVVTFMETSRETNGARSVIENRCGAGGGVPLHYHNEFDEEIVAVDGPLTVTLGNRTLTLQPGERVVVPRGTPHCFRNATSGEVTFQANLVPGSTGFENFLRVLAGLSQDGKVNRAGLPDLRTFAMMSRWADTNLCGALSVMNPVMSLLARRAEKSGLGDRLRARYECD